MFLANSTDFCQFCARLALNISRISGTLSQEYPEIDFSGISGIFYQEYPERRRQNNLYQYSDRYCKKIDLDENNTLLVELIDDLIVLKKHESHLTKIEISKAKTVVTTSNDNTYNPSQKVKVDDFNPLDGHEF